MKYFLKRKAYQNDKGTAAIEFAFIAPVMCLMLLGLFDVSNFVYCNHKMVNTVQEISNIVTRGDLTKPQLDALLKVSDLVSQPFDFAKSGNIIVTSVSQTNADLTKPPQIMWQDSYPGSTAGSRINPGSLPGGLSLTLNQTVIFTEVFFTYTPSFPVYNLISSSNAKIYIVAASFPRQGTMTTLPAS